MAKIDEARERLATLQAEIRAFADKEELDEEEETRFATALEEGKAAAADVSKLEERAKTVAAINAISTEEIPGADEMARRDAPGQINRRNPFDVDMDSRTREARVARRDSALQILEESHKNGVSLSERQEDHLDSLLRKNSGPTFNSDYIAKRAIVTENEHYHSAWVKVLTSQGVPQLTAEEGRALQAFKDFESRAASEGTPAAGGYGVPILIDPSIILTSGALDAPILSHARTVTITTDQWKGVTSQGLTFEWTAEAAAVADKTPTLAQPAIPVYRADGFIPYSFEIGQDYPGFAEEMSGLLSQGYLNLLASGTMTGLGTSNQMTGLFTALAASGAKCANGDSGTVVTVTTLGVFNGVDIRKTWYNLPELFRGKASWVTNVQDYELVRALGSVAAGYAAADFSADMTKADGAAILGREVILSDYAPAYVNTTLTTQQFLVVGDLSKYMIVQRAGMVVEQVNHLFSTSTGFPTGQRGWLAWARLGGNCLAANPFRVLSNGG